MKHPLDLGCILSQDDNSNRTFSGVSAKKARVADSEGSWRRGLMDHS